MTIREYVVEMLTKFKAKIVDKFYDKIEIDSKVSAIDSAITTVNNEAVHDNRSILDKISEDIDGNFLYGTSKFVKQSDYDTFKLSVDNSISNIESTISDMNTDISSIEGNISTIESDISSMKTDISNISGSADATKIMIDVTENGTTSQMTLQEVINKILAGGYSPVVPTTVTVAEAGLIESGETECGA